MILFQGSTGLTSGMSRENQISSNEGRCGFWPQHRWAQGFSKCSAFQSLALISLGLPSIPGKPVLWYLLLSPVITCIFTSLIDCGFYRAETKLYSSLKVSRGLTSCLMNEYWIEKCLLQHRSDQQLWCSGSCDLCLRSVEKRVCGDSREEIVSGDHPLEGSLCNRHWTGCRGKNNPCPPGLHHLEEEKDSSATPTPRAKKGRSRRTP